MPTEKVESNFPLQNHLDIQENSLRTRDILDLAKNNPHSLAIDIKKRIKEDPKSESLIIDILGKSEYDRIKNLNTKALSEDKSIASAQGKIYALMDIDPETDKNTTKNKLIKGLIDSLIVSNAELVAKIIETKGGVLRDMISIIFSLEGLKQIAEALGESVLHLFSGDAYKTGKSIGELGLVTFGSGAGSFVLKKGGKKALELSSKEALKSGKETLLSQGLSLTGKTLDTAGNVVGLPSKVAGKVGEKTTDAVLSTLKGTGNILSRTGKAVAETNIARSTVGALGDATEKIIEALPLSIQKHIDYTKQNIQNIGIMLAGPQMLAQGEKLLENTVKADQVSSKEGGIKVYNTSREVGSRHPILSERIKELSFSKLQKVGEGICANLNTDMAMRYYTGESRLKPEKMSVWGAPPFKMITQINDALKPYGYGMKVVRPMREEILPLLDKKILQGNITPILVYNGGPHYVTVIGKEIIDGQEVYKIMDPLKDVKISQRISGEDLLKTMHYELDVSTTSATGQVRESVQRGLNRFLGGTLYIIDELPHLRKKSHPPAANDPLWADHKVA